MPDANGMPTVKDCLQKIDLVAPEPIAAALIEDVQAILNSVIAAFQSPFTPQGDGGTGRRFVPIEATRSFHGNGRSEFQVSDIVPETDFVVKAFGQILDDVLIKEADEGQGWNILYRPVVNGVTTGFWFGLGQGMYGGYGPNPLFPDGTNNIEVTATWGFAATVPIDVYEAIRGEVCYRTIVQGVVGLNGVGEEIEIGNFSLSTSVGAINFNLTSPLTVFHSLYEKTVRRYRFRRTESVRRNQRRMR